MQKIEIIHMICDLCRCKNIFWAQHQKIFRIARGEEKLLTIQQQIYVKENQCNYIGRYVRGNALEKSCEGWKFLKVYKLLKFLKNSKIQKKFC